MGQEFLEITPAALDLDRIKQNQREYGAGQPERRIQIRGPEHAQIRDTGSASCQWQRIDRQQIHDIHQVNPDEYDQRQRRNQFAVAVKKLAHLGVNELIHDFDKILPATRRAARNFDRGDAKQPYEQQTKHQRNDYGIDIEHPEARGLSIETERRQVELQKLQMMMNIGTGRCAVFC